MKVRFGRTTIATIAILLLPSIFLLPLGGCGSNDETISSPTIGTYNALFASTNGCCVVNGDFSEGFTGWTNESEGPGLSSGVQEIVDVDGRTDVLHLDSRDGGDYYLFHTQTIATCGILDKTLQWDWKLDEIESAYGLAAVWLEFKDGAGDVLGRYFVRRHTGDFAAYACTTLTDEMCTTNYPDDAIGCEQLTDTSFAWESKALVFDAAFFSALECNALDPADVDSIKIWIQSYNNAGAGVDAYFDNFEYSGCRQFVVVFDIKPGSCKNPINPKSQGKLPAAILGTADLDVTDIDVSSLLLEGVAPLRSSIEDVSAPLAGGDPCDCTKDGPDGYDDLTLKFETQDIVGAIGPLTTGDVHVLTLTGNLLDGTPLEMSDHVTVVGKPEKTSPATSDKKPDPGTSYSKTSD